MAVVPRNIGGGDLHASTQRGDSAFRGTVLLFTSLVVLAAIALVVSLVVQAWPAIQQTGLGVFKSATWNPDSNLVGGLTFIYGTLATSLIAILLAGVVGVMVAVFLVELAPPLFARPVSFLVEMLAAVPSIIFGFFGIFVLIPLLLPFEQGLGKALGFIPFFGGAVYSGHNLLSTGIVLAIMILPTVAALSRDVMTAVPGSQREGMLALGATRWETVRHVVIPYARAGIVGAIILGLGRATGETMAATMIIGNSSHFHVSLLQPGYSLAAVLAAEANEAFSSPLHIGALFELGLILLLISVVLNVAARLLVWRANRGGGATSVRA